ncbi:type II toxin-antitoxin system HipA family toxin [Aliikangiella marina]|uniref:Type II toxin-antitoxin system HipA family toxin n=1 Tax=Aliikangiella marina TaxID=1712262 RepID=A0A545TJ70_9GAMM|nr:type II toxin-antitoxin system HipA family toxin [Aliikangiella marina]TQV77258.1 type II toxin-antitoxin system HipA family toxin [Aliikangiella marina]
MENIAEVKLWGDQVGALAYDPSSGLTTFEYSPVWRKKSIQISPIHMPLSAQKYQFPELSYETYKGLPAIFADALPDDFGNAVINAWLARQGRDPASFTSVERLLYTGSRGMGALEFAPAIRDQKKDTPPLEIDSLVNVAQQVLDERAQANQKINQLDSQENDLSAILQVGTSAGGARAKAIVAVNADRTEIRSGQVDAGQGFEHYLLKLDGVEEHKTSSETFGDPQGFGRMEYAYYLMAKDAGLNMSHCELLVEGKRAHFLTKRFDRIGNKKLHYASLCAMDHADYKKPGIYSYEQLLMVARQLSLPRQDAVEIFRRMVFNIVARNHDDHPKNFGFLLAPGSSQWRLSPAFDVAFSYKPDSPWVNSHQLTLNAKRDNFNRDDLIQFSNLINNFRESPKVISQVVEAVENWPFYAKKAQVFPQLTDTVASNLRVGNGFHWI